MQDKFAEAEAVCREAVDIQRRELPPTSVTFGETLNTLAVTLAQAGRRAEAEPLFREVLAIDRKSYTADHPQLAQSMNNLATVLEEQGRLAEAEPLRAKVLSFAANRCPPVILIARKAGDLAVVLQKQGKLTEAETTARESLAIRRTALSAEHPDTASTLQILGTVLREQHRYAEAEPALLEAAKIFSRPNLGRKRYADCVNELVILYTAWDRAEPHKGYADQANQWQSRISTTQPATRPKSSDFISVS